MEKIANRCPIQVTKNDVKKNLKRQEKTTNFGNDYEQYSRTSYHCESTTTTVWGTHLEEGRVIRLQHQELYHYGETNLQHQKVRLLATTQEMWPIPHRKYFVTLPRPSQGTPARQKIQNKNLKATSIPVSSSGRATTHVTASRRLCWSGREARWESKELTFFQLFESWIGQWR